MAEKKHREKYIYHEGRKYIPGAADIGNSRTKLIIKEYRAAFEHGKKNEAGLRDFLISNSNEPVLIGYSSVNNKVINALLDLTDDIENIKFLNTKPLLEKQDIIDFSDIKGIGADRLLGLIGAASEFTPPFITVDCGTAITINALDKDYLCRGGTIAAGIYTQIKSLAENAEGLDYTDLKKVERASARNTADALNSGIVLGTAGAVKTISERISMEEFGLESVRLILTGGYSELIGEHLSELGMEVHIRKNLVLQGILSLLDQLDII
jgi:pantothenate kinase type III